MSGATDKPVQPLPVVETPYLAMDEAASYLRYRSVNAAIVVRAQLRKNKIPLYRRNRKVWLVRRVDLDEWISTGQCIEGQRYWMDQQRRAAMLKPVPYNPPSDLGKNRPGRPRKNPPLHAQE